MIDLFLPTSFAIDMLFCLSVGESSVDVWLTLIMAPPGCAESAQPGGAGVNMTLNVHEIKFKYMM